MNQGFQSEFLSYVKRLSSIPSISGEENNVESAVGGNSIRECAVPLESGRSSSPASSSGIISHFNEEEQDSDDVNKSVEATGQMRSKGKIHCNGERNCLVDDVVGAKMEDRKMGKRYSDKMESKPKEGEKKGSGSVEPLLVHRPKRHIIPKNLEYSAGLSWREENDLKKALYASLQESKKGGIKQEGPDQLAHSLSRGNRKDRLKSKGLQAMDDSSQDSTRSGVSSENNQEHKDFSFRARVHAQRKFAQGSRPGSPNVTPRKVKPTPKKFFTTKKAKTEDFLTFLCLRGSHSLPPHLDFYNMEDSDENGTSNPPTPKSRPNTPAFPLGGKSSRGVSPTRSKASSPDREINLVQNDLGVHPLAPMVEGRVSMTGESSHPPSLPGVSTSSPHNSVVTAISPHRNMMRPLGFSQNSVAKAQAEYVSLPEYYYARQSAAARSLVVPAPRQARPTSRGGHVEQPRDDLPPSSSVRISRSSASRHSTSGNTQENPNKRQSSASPNKLLPFVPLKKLKQDQVKKPKVLSPTKKPPTSNKEQSSKKRKANATRHAEVKKPRMREMGVKSKPMASQKETGRRLVMRAKHCVVKLVKKKREMATRSVTAAAKQSRAAQEKADNEAIAVRETLRAKRDAARASLAATHQKRQGPGRPPKSKSEPAVSERRRSEKTEPPQPRTERSPETRSQKAKAEAAALEAAQAAAAKAEKETSDEVIDDKDSPGQKRQVAKKSAAKISSAKVGSSPMSSKLNTTALSRTTMPSPKTNMPISKLSMSSKSALGKGFSSPKMISTAKMYVTPKGGLTLKSIPKSAMMPKISVTTKVTSSPKSGTFSKSSTTKGSNVITSKSTIKVPGMSKVTTTLTHSISPVKVQSPVLKVPSPKLISRTTIVKNREPSNSTVALTKPTCDRSPMSLSKQTVAKAAAAKSDSAKPVGSDTKHQNVNETVVKQTVATEGNSKKNLVKDPQMEPLDLSKSGIKLKKKYVSSPAIASALSTVLKKVASPPLSATRERAISVASMSSTTQDSDTESVCSRRSLTRASAGGRRSSISTSAGSPGPSPIPSPSPRQRAMPVARVAYRQYFPTPDEPARLVEVPTYHPSPEQFQDPISYIASIQMNAEPFGMCRIVPPDDWKPDCRIQDDLKFPTQVQHVHKLQNRYGPNAVQFECIKKHNESQGIKLDAIPVVGFVELDLPVLYDTMQKLGGMQTVINKNKWQKVAEALRLPKMAVDQSSRLYDVYCKYLLSYDMLSKEEKSRLEQQVLAERKSKQSPGHECLIKGRNKQLGEFFRHSRNLLSMWFKEEPTPKQVETEHAKILEGAKHVAVQTAHIDAKVYGSGFPTRKENSHSSPYTRHGWNFNILQHNSGSVLKGLGPVTGVNCPTLLFTELFSTSCWSCDRHLLPYLVYNHTGANVIWYSIPHTESDKFRSVVSNMCPDLVEDKSMWLPEDSIMISPTHLLDEGVSLGRVVQEQGQFLIVFSQTNTASVSCGYNLSEMLHFATPDWIPLGCRASRMLNESFVTEKFSMDRLLFRLARHEKTSSETLRILLPHLTKSIETEIGMRQNLVDVGLRKGEKMITLEDVTPSKYKRHEMQIVQENRCKVSKKICFMSMVVNENEDAVYSLEHALPHIQKKKNLKACRLVYRYEEKEMLDLIERIKTRVTGTNTPPKKKSSKARLDRMH